MWENPAMVLSPRSVFAFIFLACAALLAFAILYLQEQVGLDPCPMCILQRYAFIAVGIVALIGAIHGRAPRVYASLVVLLSLVGAGVAIRHTWIQYFPPPARSCGADLDFMLNAFPLQQALPKIFAGTGDCSEIKWRLLLTIPEWSIVWFVIFAALGTWIVLRRRPAARFGGAPRRSAPPRSCGRRSGPRSFRARVSLRIPSRSVSRPARRAPTAS